MRCTEMSPTIGAGNVRISPWHGERRESQRNPRSTEMVPSNHSEDRFVSLNATKQGANPDWLRRVKPTLELDSKLSLQARVLLMDQAIDFFCSGRRLDGVASGNWTSLAKWSSGSASH